MPSSKKQETSSATRWNPGDQVMLKSGGPTMTVKKQGKGSDAEVICQWFVGGDLHEGEFGPDMLERTKGIFPSPLVEGELATHGEGEPAHGTR